MNDEIKTKTLVSVLVIGIIIVIFASVLSLVYIWMPKKKKVEVYKPGQYDNKSINDEDMAIRYSGQIAKLLLSKNYEALYNLVSEEYKSRFNMNDINKFKSFIDSKGLIGKESVCKSFLSQEINGKRYYNMKIATKDNYINMSLLLIEDSPDIYTISFDDFMYSRNLNKEYSKDGFKITILREELRTDKVFVKAKIENFTGYNVVINNALNKNPLSALVGPDEVDITNSLPKSAKIDLPEGGSKEVDIEVDIPAFTHRKLKKLIFKDVIVQNGKGSTNIEIPYSVIDND